MNSPLLFLHSPAMLQALWQALLPALVLAGLGWQVLLHGRRKLQAQDRRVALAWWLGVSSALGSALAVLPLLAGATLVPAPAGVPMLHLSALAATWVTGLAGVGVLLLASRAAGEGWRGWVLTGALLGTQHWLAQQWVLQDLQAVAMVPLVTTWGLMAPAQGASLLALATAFAVALADKGRPRAGLVMFTLGVGCAMLVGWPWLPLQWQTSEPGQWVLDALAVRLLSGFSGLMLLLGWVVSEVDRQALVHGRALSHSLSQANHRLREQALRDPLTKLPNRLQFEQQLEEALLRAGTRSTEAQGGLAVMFLDLDGFKPVNDSFGHVAGDAVLREVARRLRAAVRPADLIARVGGDEFIALCERPGSPKEAAEIARRLLAACSQPCVLPNLVEVKLSCAIGIVLYPQTGEPSKLIAQADAAMYAAKRAGGGTFAFYEPSMEQDARNQLGLQSDLRAALAQGELELFYQPKIDGLSGQITGVEALVRWPHPQRGPIMPGLFIPVAERFGLIGQLGEWVIEESCRQLHAWREQGLRMRVAINMSAHQLRDPHLLDRLQAAMKQHGVEPSQLTIEIIESVLMDDAAVHSFTGLASLGVGLSIDDFGIGYCNFALLRKLPVKQLKVDRSLFTDVLDSADARAVVMAIVRMAHALGLRVVAEGVETPEQRDLLLRLQCDELQGYLFARPMSAAKLTLWAMDDERRPDAEGAFRPSTFVDTQPTPS